MRTLSRGDQLQNGSGMLLNMNSTQGASVGEGRTKTFSLRLTEAEHTKLREVALRLGATEAAVIRYAIRSMLTRVAPLYDPGARGFSLLPVFVECGAELSSYFDLDVTRLEHIINGEDTDADHKVEKDDLVLLSMSGLGEPRVHAKLRELQQGDVKQENVPKTLRTYFYDKYIYKDSADDKKTR